MTPTPSDPSVPSPTPAMDPEPWATVRSSALHPPARSEEAAGAHPLLRYGQRQQRNLLRVLDIFGAGIFLCDGFGREIHRNPAADGLLREDPEHPRIREEIEVLKRSLRLLARNPAPPDTRPSPLRRTVRTARGAYLLRGFYLEEGALEDEAAILVAVEPVAPHPLSDEEARQRYGLTPREMEITRLLATGKTTRALAAELCLSRHTVRRHVEQILMKLGVHNRAEVVHLVLHGGPAG